MAAIYFDECFDETVRPFLVALGHTVITQREDGRAGRGLDDSEVVIRASELGMAVATINHRDYVKIHRSGAHHAGIISCTVDRNSASLAARIDAAVRDLPSLQGQLLRIVRPNPPA